MFENRRWLVIPAELVDSIDFNQVQESSVDSLRYSVDGTKTFIKYDIFEVLEDFTTEFINAETGEPTTYTTEAGIYGRPSVYSEELEEYNHNGILELLATPEWSADLTLE
jgi:hypothetical protein